MGVLTGGLGVGCRNEGGMGNEGRGGGGVHVFRWELGVDYIGSKLL